MNLTVTPLLPLALLVVLTGCGGGSDGAGGNGTAGGSNGTAGGSNGTAGGNGTVGVTDGWQAYCVATFTSNYPVVDDFGDTTFTAHSGDQYLMTQYGDDFGQTRAGLLYLTSSGPWEFTITAAGGSATFPFTSNCQFGNTTDYYAAFTNVSVFAAADLTMQICGLSAGMAELRAGTPAGYSLAGNLTFSGPSTYQVELGPFSSRCRGAPSGYVSVPETQVFGTTTWLVPLRAIIGPAQ